MCACERARACAGGRGGEWGGECARVLKSARRVRQTPIGAPTTFSCVLGCDSTRARTALAVSPLFSHTHTHTLMADAALAAAAAMGAPTALERERGAAALEAALAAAGKREGG